MEAVCRGAREAGGLTIGILPGDDRAQANPYVDVAVATGLGEARNVLVVRSADVVVAVGGEYGTLSEIALALGMGRVVVGIDTWELAKGGHGRWTPTPSSGSSTAAEAAAAAAQAILRSTTSEKATRPPRPRPGRRRPPGRRRCRAPARRPTPTPSPAGGSRPPPAR